MKQLILALTVMLTATGAYAQGKKSLVDIDKELKQTKSSTTAMALIESIAETVPQTDEEVAALGRLMDKYPAQGQRAMSKIKDPKLAKAVMKESDRQALKIKAVRTKGEDNLTISDRQDYLNSYLNSAAAIDVLSKLNNKAVVPLLRSYLQDEDLSRFASVALGRLGDTASLDSMLGNIGHGKDVDLSGYGDQGLVRVVEELDKSVTDTKRKDALIDQIKGSASPERKRMLKDLALNHKDARVRDRSGLALLNSIMVNPEAGDNMFVSEWVGKTKNDEAGYWAVSSVRVSHGNGAKPLNKSTIALLADVMRTSSYSPTRSEAAQSLGIFRVGEAATYLKECAYLDKDYTVRNECRFSYWRITGEVPSAFNASDALALKKRLDNPRTHQFYEKLGETDQDKLYFLSLKHAFDEYARNNK